MAERTETQLNADITSRIKSLGVPSKTTAADLREVLRNMVDSLFGLVRFPAGYITTFQAGNLPANTDMTGKTVMDAWRLATTRSFAPLAVGISVNNTLFEEGSTGTVTVSGSVSANDETAITTRRVLRNGSPWQTFTGNTFSFPDTLTADTTYRVEVTGGTSGTKTATAAVNFDLLHRFGPSAAVPTAASARSLSGSAWRDGGNAFPLNTGTAEKRFYILLAPNESLVSVVDQDALNLDITSEYALVNSNFSVNNAAGTPVAGYRLYEKAQGVPYTANHRHNITIA